MISCKLNHLRLFREADIFNSLAKAGENLRISEADALQAIGEIEREFGGPLYDRDKEGFDLTSRGFVLTGRLIDFFDILDPALEAISPRLKFDLDLSRLRELVVIHKAGDFALGADLLDLPEETVRRRVEQIEEVAGQ